MKRKLRWLIILVPLLICVVVTGIYAYLFVLSDDTTAPVISVETEILEVSVYATEEELLQGVTAKDDVDGDISARLMVEGTSQLMEDNSVIATYAAVDTSGNVAKVQRTLKYTDYKPPVFGLTDSLVLRSGSSLDVLTLVSANDLLDGDISRRVKGTMLSSTGSLSYTGIHDVEFRVTNSLGDTQKIILPVEVVANNVYNATVDLGDEYLIRIRRGAVFKPETFLEKLIVGTTEYSLKNQNPPIENLTREQIQALGDDRDLEVRTYINNYVDPEDNEDPFVGIVNVDIDNDVISTIPGIYSVTYTVNYEDRYVGYARLNVVVEE